MTHPTTTPTPRICPNCDGFATAAITTGSRDRHGHLRTITANCPACNGLGTVPARRIPEVARA
jgi:DnaJ-class molecular chaperone